MPSETSDMFVDAQQRASHGGGTSRASPPPPEPPQPRPPRQSAPSPPHSDAPDGVIDLTGSGTSNGGARAPPLQGGLRAAAAVERAVQMLELTLTLT